MWASGDQKAGRGLGGSQNLQAPLLCWSNLKGGYGIKLLTQKENTHVERTGPMPA